LGFHSLFFFPIHSKRKSKTKNEERQTQQMMMKTEWKKTRCIDGNQQQQKLEAQSFYLLFFIRTNKREIKEAKVWCIVRSISMGGALVAP
jgi:hypothetical protein